MGSTTALFLLLVQTVLYAQSSLIQIDSENHLYQRLTVEVTDQVPRHLCQETLSHLEVRKMFFVKKIGHINSIWGNSYYYFFVLINKRKKLHTQ